MPHSTSAITLGMTCLSLALLVLMAGARPMKRQTPEDNVNCLWQCQFNRMNNKVARNIPNNLYHFNNSKLFNATCRLTALYSLMRNQTGSPLKDNLGAYITGLCQQVASSMNLSPQNLNCSLDDVGTSSLAHLCTRGTVWDHIQDGIDVTKELRGNCNVNPADCLD